MGFAWRFWIGTSDAIRPESTDPPNRIQKIFRQHSAMFMAINYATMQRHKPLAHAVCVHLESLDGMRTSAPALKRREAEMKVVLCNSLEPTLKAAGFRATLLRRSKTFREMPKTVQPSLQSSRRPEAPHWEFFTENSSPRITETYSRSPSSAISSVDIHLCDPNLSLHYAATSTSAWAAADRARPFFGLFEGAPSASELRWYPKWGERERERERDNKSEL